VSGSSAKGYNRRQSMRALAPLGFVLSATIASVAAAQTPRVLVGDVPCIPRGGNAVVSAAAAPLAEGAEVRVYFRRQGYGDFYWVPAHPAEAGGAAFWAVLPVPEPDNTMAEIYAAVYGLDGKPLGQSRVRQVPVAENRQAELDGAQQSEASHLTIGETALGQMYRKVAWWRCEGVRERVNVRGERRDDEVCVPAPWWQRAMIVPVIFAAGVTTVQVGVHGVTPLVPDVNIIPPDELSPVTP
jgi:hypothetical protein